MPGATILEMIAATVHIIALYELNKRLSLEKAE